jgi:hypothetical protein
VFRLRRIVALLLTALWLPAMLHCNLETAGLGSLFRCETDHDATASTATADSCDVVEDGRITRDSGEVTVVAPILAQFVQAFVRAVSTLEFAPPVEALTGAEASPREIACAWQFVARAAPPSRAPSLIS